MASTTVHNNIYHSDSDSVPVGTLCWRLSGSTTAIPKSCAGNPGTSKRFDEMRESPVYERPNVEPKAIMPGTTCRDL